MGRHLAETPYTSPAYGSDTSLALARVAKSEPIEPDLRRVVSVASAGSDTGSKKNSREQLGASGSSGGPRFTDAPMVIDADGTSDCGLYDDGDTTDVSKAHSKINKRVLTQRYQLDQMRNIRKKISVEDSLCEQLDRFRSYYDQVTPFRNSFLPWSKVLPVFLQAKWEQ